MNNFNRLIVFLMLLTLLYALHLYQQKIENRNKNIPNKAKQHNPINNNNEPNQQNQPNQANNNNQDVLTQKESKKYNNDPDDNYDDYDNLSYGDISMTGLSQISMDSETIESEY
jgi:hypothetical protein